MGNGGMVYTTSKRLLDARGPVIATNREIRMYSFREGITKNAIWRCTQLQGGHGHDSTR
jgi:hypothetical protein